MPVVRKYDVGTHGLQQIKNVVSEVRHILEENMPGVGSLTITEGKGEYNLVIDSKNKKVELKLLVTDKNLETIKKEREDKIKTILKTLEYICLNHSNQFNFNMSLEPSKTLEKFDSAILDYDYVRRVVFRGDVLLSVIYPLYTSPLKVKTINAKKEDVPHIIGKSGRNIQYVKNIMNCENVNVNTIEKPVHDAYGKLLGELYNLLGVNGK